jgi:hypothetical protein
MVLTLMILATWEANIRRIMAHGHAGQIVGEAPIPKITRAKWTGSVAQAVENLPWKCEVLSSKPQSHPK